ncbi:MAG: tyrosine-type recombinase/integrase [Coriobacteriia bacterium]
MADDTGIRQRGDRWQVRVCYEDMAGKRHTLTDTCATKTGARRKRDEFRAVRDSGQNIGTGRETLKAYLETWLTRREERGGLSPITCESYRRNVERYIVPNIGGVELRKLTAEHVELLLDALGKTPHYRTGEPLSAQTQQHAFRVLHKALEDALRQGRIASNPCHLVSGPKVERHELATLTAKQVATLLASLKASEPDWLYMAAVLGVTTGLRRGEVLALRWAEVDLKAAEALIVRSTIPAKGGAITKEPKSEASRSVVPLAAFAVAELKAYSTRQKERRLEAGSMWQDSGLVIDNGLGAPVSPGHLSKSFTEAAKTAKTPATFHGLRHTFTSLHHDAGTPLKVLQELVRHSSPALLLSRYGHTLPGAHEAAADRLDAVLRKAR